MSLEFLKKDDSPKNLKISAEKVGDIVDFTQKKTREQVARELVDLQLSGKPVELPVKESDDWSIFIKEKVKIMSMIQQLSTQGVFTDDNLNDPFFKKIVNGLSLVAVQEQHKEKYEHNRLFTAEAIKEMDRGYLGEKMDSEFMENLREPLEKCLETVVMLQEKYADFFQDMQEIKQESPAWFDYILENNPHLRYASDAYKKMKDITFSQKKQIVDMEKALINKVGFSDFDLAWQLNGILKEGTIDQSFIDQSFGEEFTKTINNKELNKEDRQIYLENFVIHKCQQLCETLIISAIYMKALPYTNFEVAEDELYQKMNAKWQKDRLEISGQLGEMNIDMDDKLDLFVQFAHDSGRKRYSQTGFSPGGIEELITKFPNYSTEETGIISRIDSIYFRHKKNKEFISGRKGHIAIY